MRVGARLDGNSWRGPWIFWCGRRGIRFYWDGWRFRDWKLRRKWAHFGPLSVVWWLQQ